MRFLLIGDKTNFTVYSPELYGCESWGSNSQRSLIKKRKHWYFKYWSYGGEYNDDEIEEYKCNVIFETTDIDEIIDFITKKCAKKNRTKLIKKALDEIEKLYQTWIEFIKWVTHIHS